MAERQITVGQQTYRLPELFMVLATQNPVEHEGTYTLPEAQLDRFLLYVIVDYPNRTEEMAVLELMETPQVFSSTTANPLDQASLFAARQSAMTVYLDPKLKEYIVDLVQASRYPAQFDNDLQRWQRFGASPRASIALVRCARALAWLQGEKYVSPEHIQQVLPDILRHRILLSFEADAEGINTTDFIQRLLQVVAIP